MRPSNALKDYYYVKDRRIGVNKEELVKWGKKLPSSVIDDGNTYEFFCDIHYPYVKDNQMMVKLGVDDGRELDIPINQIKSIARAGWPRAGIMAERLIDFPWRLLKPIYEHMREPRDINQLKEMLYKGEVYDDTMVTSMYHKEIFSWIEEGTKESLILGTKTHQKWLNELRKRYKSIIQLHKKNMLQAFSIPIGGYPYLGVIVNPKLLEIKDDNPFRKYLHTCVAHQKQILESQAPAIH